MIQKKLSILASCIALTVGAEAAITHQGLRQDSSMLLYLSAGEVGSYIYDIGFLPSELVKGFHLTLDISSSLSVFSNLGGDVESFALLGIIGGTEVYAYNFFGSWYLNSGLLYSGASPRKINEAHDFGFTQTDTVQYFDDVITQFGTASEGFIESDSAAVLNSSKFRISEFGEIITNADKVANIYSSSLEGFLDTPGWHLEPVERRSNLQARISQNNFVITTVPIPATAWLFLSAVSTLVGVRKLRVV